MNRDQEPTADVRCPCCHQVVSNPVIARLLQENADLRADAIARLTLDYQRMIRLYRAQTPR